MKTERENISWPDAAGLVLAAWLAVWVQATFDTPRNILGVRMDVLSGLMVCAGIWHGILGVALAGFTGGVLLDILSANRLGASAAPLLMVGGLIHANRRLLTCERAWPQFILGFFTGMIVPALQWLLLIALRQQPLTGPGTAWQLIATGLMGGAATPAWFLLARRFQKAVQYPNLNESSFRTDREIVRGRS